jgi:two-component system NtrC family sensor kinase
MDQHDPIQFREILDAMEDGIYITREDYTVEYMNKAMIRYFGEGVGRKCYEVINSSEVMCPWCRAKEVFTNAENAYSEIYMPMMDRTYRITEVPISNLDGTKLKLSIYRDITERRDQELKLRATEQSYRRLFEHVGVGVYISTTEGRFIDANQALLDMLGYDSKEEFLKIDIQKDLYRHPQDRLTFQNMMEKQDHVVNHMVDFKRKDGSTIPTLLTATVYRNQARQIAGYEGICIDQSQIVAMQKELKEANDFLNNIIHSSPNAIIGATLNGTIFTWNQGAEETLGYSADDVVGKMDVRELYKADEAYEVMKHMRSPEFGGSGKLRSYSMNFMTLRGASLPT